MNNYKNDKKVIKIAGAGISGITAAIVLARAGKNVEIYEQAEVIGKRFKGDLQGIENWTRQEDALDFLRKIGIEINFNYKVVNNVTFWGPDNFAVELKASKPPFYLVKRGPEEKSLDWGLQKQLEKHKNIKIFYNHPVKELHEIDIIATGPVFNDESIDVSAAGYTFNTDLPDTAIVIFNDELAKDGYSYFLVHNSYGVIATCIFSDFDKLIKYREKTLKTCQERIKFSMENVKNFIGTGNFFLGKNKLRKKIFVGEAGGYQDYLWGFGMRTAFITGYLAAKSILEGDDYYKLIEREINPFLKTSISNRFLFSMLGNRLYKLFIKKFENSNDPLKLLTIHYNPSIIKKIIYPFAYLYYWKHIKDPRKI